MHETVVNALSTYPILTLFVVIGLGYLLGEISFFGFRFGIVGVLFVGLAVGSLSPAIALPEIVSTLGLIMFIYTIGIQSGPGFFDSFRKRGVRDTALTLGVLIFGAVITFAIAFPLQLGGPRTAGLYAGALTNTPALAAVRERLREHGKAGGMAEDALRTLTDEPVVSYSLAYPFGVIGLLICFQVMRRVWRVEFTPDDRGPEIRVRDFSVRNPAVIGRTIAEVLQPHQDLGFVVSRIRKDGRSDIARSDVRLSAGDIVAVVGEDDALERAEQIFGEPSSEQIERDRSHLDYRRVFVSSENVVGKRIRDLQLEDRYTATITRVKRGDVDVVPAPNARLEYGDRVRVLTRRENFEAISRLFGDSIKGQAETDFGSVAIGMVIGVMVGLLPIPLGNTTIRLGLAGGPLLVALILGKLERSGRVTWIIPISANLTLRQIGLLFFLAGVGTKAGYQFSQTLRANGWQMLVAGAVVTFAVTMVTMIVGYKWLKMPFESVMGVVSGIHTQPAALAYASKATNSEAPNVAYAGVYPVAMIAKILLAQLLT